MAAPEAPAPRRGWRERWIGWRNSLISNPKFQSWATALPIGRSIARSEAARLFDLVAGFVYSQILAACVRLDLFAILAAGPRSIDDLARQLAVPPAGAERLLKAAAALDLAEILPDGRYALGRLGAAFLGNPGIAPMIAHHAIFYADLADPVAVLRGAGGTQLSEFWAYGADSAGDTGPYSQLMAASQPLVAQEIMRAYDFGRHRRLLDIGGGTGAFLAAVRASHPALDLALFDLPGVVARAALPPRGIAVGGDMRTDALPSGADIATLVRVLHDHDDPDAMAILVNARAALPPGGTLLVAEPMAEAAAAKRMGDAYFGFYLAAMGRGRPRTSNEIRQMLSRAGFADSRLLPAAMPLLVQVIAARV